MKIGLEMHVALPTKSKLFCSCSTEQVEEPNVNICPICMGFPGSRPVLNAEAVRIAKAIATVLKCEVKDKISFIRKIYFYPDLPKSFQITQLSEAIGSKGSLAITDKDVGIRRIQIEEDPAKIVRQDNYSLKTIFFIILLLLRSMYLYLNLMSSPGRKASFSSPISKGGISASLIVSISDA